MTNEETIKRLESIKHDIIVRVFQQDIEAIDAAIKALESQDQAIKEAYDKGYEYGVKEWFDKRTKSQPCEDVVSREAVDKLSRDLVHVTRDKADFLCNFWEGLYALPPVTPQASEEDIHREREQAYMLGYEDASKKFRTEPCEDCISREAVIDKAFDFMDDDCETYRAVYVSDIRKLPSVTPTSEDIKEAYFKGYDYGVKDWFKSKTQPCKDAASKQIRDCENCIHHKDGCCEVWDCQFEPKEGESDDKRRNHS